VQNLIVENDPDMLFLLQTSLRNCGYFVEGLDNGNSIVESKRDLPDLFILERQRRLPDR
jgi:DNA-binding response OmpR family regulator